MDRREASKQLRQSLARYRGGRFEATSSGGAGGMMFFIDQDGKRWFIGGMNAEHSQTVTDALNLVLDLLAQ